MKEGVSEGVQNVYLNTNELYFGQNMGIEPAIAGKKHSIHLEGRYKRWFMVVKMGVQECWAL